MAATKLHLSVPVEPTDVEKRLEKKMKHYKQRQ